MILLLLASTFLNGVNIDTLRGQTFEKCKTVKIDDRGDVYLDCPGYQVQQQNPGTPPAAPVVPAAVATAITKHYWMVSEDANSAQAQYDLDVFINSKWIRKIKAGEGQIVVEITKYLQPGPNKVLFAATKHMEAGRKSASAAAYVKVVVGEGEAGGNTVMIDNPLVECKRTAAETDNVNEEFTIQGR
ncbi:MAG TPA: hypothetical protein VLW85_18390 [Myxococcales bacterium]|nr:hypothetical protein [Myxococcales bacterium]